VGKVTQARAKYEERLAEETKVREKRVGAHPTTLIEEKNTKRRDRKKE